VEFARKKAAPLQREDTGFTPTNQAEEYPRFNRNDEMGGAMKWCWRPLALVGLVVTGSGGWALTNWTGFAARSPSVVSATSKLSAPVSAPSANGAPFSIRSLSDEKQVDLAFDAVFGRGARQIRVPEQAVYTYANGKVVWTDFGAILIAEGTGDKPYPVALGALGLFYLREMPGMKFEEVRRWPDAVVGSAMASPPQWKVRQDITDQLVIESTAGGVWQGYACDATTLTELTPVGPLSLVTFDSYFDSSGAVEEGNQTFEGTIINVVRNRSFDVSFKGTRTIIEHFVRKGASYVRVTVAGEQADQSVIPTC